MFRLQASAIVVLVGVAVPALAARFRSPAEDLLQVVTPASRQVASAHPDVNVIVAFGRAKDGTPADPSTFRAWFQGKEITGRFTPILTDGAETGKRAVLDGDSLRAGKARNRLRLVVEGEHGEGRRRLRDKDRVRFGAADAPNQPPVAMLAADASTVTLGVATTFDATGSTDPDLDGLEIAWTFSDGGTATGSVAAHAFGASDDGVVRATVHVSDGQATVDETVALPTRLEVDPGRTPGTVRIDADGPLEFSATPLGTTATRTLVVRNVDDAPADQAPASQVKARASAPAPFGASPDALLALDPGDSAEITVTFAPGTEGHAAARVVLALGAANRDAVILLAHGWGGAGGGDGPTGLGVPVFGITGAETVLLAPDGGRTPLDLSTGTCRLTGDVCTDGDDCGAAGGTCDATATAIDVSELCFDGASVVVLSEDSFTELRDEPETDLAGSLVRFDLGAGGTVTGREMIYRTTEDTAHVACDPIPAAQGGLAYVAEFRNVIGPANCDRDERDALVSVNKATGNARTVSGFSRLDAVPGVGECEFRDGVAQLEIAPDGVARFAGFDSSGLWRISPTPLPFTRDVADRFQIHPDGSVAFAVARDRGATGAIELYRLTPAQVENGALALAALSPCATFTVPNNAERGAPGLTFAPSFVLGAAASGGDDAVGLVTFGARPAAGAAGVLPPHGDVRGTVAFALPAHATTCSTGQLVTLEARDMAR